MKLEKLLAPLLALNLYACNTSDNNEIKVEPLVDMKYKPVVQQIYDGSEWSAFVSIAECDVDEEKIFTEAPIGIRISKKNVYDRTGEKIGTCNYSDGSVSTICKELSGSCKEVFISKGSLAQTVAPDKNLYQINTAIKN